MDERASDDSDGNAMLVAGLSILAFVTVILLLLAWVAWDRFGPVAAVAAIGGGLLAVGPWVLLIRKMIRGSANG